MTEQVEELTRGDALARVAVLEAELAELRGRECVPDGYVVVPVEPTPEHIDSIAMRYRHDFGLLPEDQRDNLRRFARQLYEECTGQGFYKLAAPAPVERCPNCDGTGDVHRADGKWLGECTCGAAPVERVGQVPKVFWALFDNTTDVKYIKKDSDAGTLAFFDNEEDAAWAKRFNPGTDYKRVEYYTTPQPAAPAPDVAGLVEALGWYAEKAELCRKFGAAGDSARHALDFDGGFRAREALAAHQSGGAKT